MNLDIHEDTVLYLVTEAVWITQCYLCHFLNILADDNDLRDILIGVVRMLTRCIFNRSNSQVKSSGLCPNFHNLHNMNRTL